MKTWSWLVPGSIVLNCLLIILVAESFIDQTLGWPSTLAIPFAIFIGMVGLAVIWFWTQEQQQQRHVAQREFPELSLSFTIRQGEKKLGDLIVDFCPLEDIKIANVHGWMEGDVLQDNRENPQTEACSADESQTENIPHSF